MKNGTTQIIGRATFSILLVAISLFAMCSGRLHRLDTGLDYDIIDDDEIGKDSFLDKLELVDTDSAVAPGEESQPAATAASPTVSATETSEVAPVPESIMNKLRAVVDAEINGTPANAATPTTPKVQPPPKTESVEFERLSERGRLMRRQAFSGEIEEEGRKGPIVTTPPAPAAKPEVFAAATAATPATTMPDRSAPSRATTLPAAKPAAASASQRQPDRATSSASRGNTRKIIEPEAAQFLRAAIADRPATAFDLAYQDALDDFYTHRTSSAIAKLRALLLRKDAGDLADNCQYWIGEAYFARGDYYQAIAEFEKVASYTNSNKIMDAKLMSGIALMRMGAKQQAMGEFNFLLTFYKNKNIAHKARVYLDMLERV